MWGGRGGVLGGRRDTTNFNKVRASGFQKNIIITMCDFTGMNDVCQILRGLYCYALYYFLLVQQKMLLASLMFTNGVQITQN